MIRYVLRTSPNSLPPLQSPIPLFLDKPFCLRVLGSGNENRFQVIRTAPKCSHIVQPSPTRLFLVVFSTYTWPIFTTALYVTRSSPVQFMLMERKHFLISYQASSRYHGLATESLQQAAQYHPLWYKMPTERPCRLLYDRTTDHALVQRVILRWHADSPSFVVAIRHFLPTAPPFSYPSLRPSQRLLLISAPIHLRRATSLLLDTSLCRLVFLSNISPHWCLLVSLPFGVLPLPSLDFSSWAALPQRSAPCHHYQYEPLRFFLSLLRANFLRVKYHHSMCRRKVYILLFWSRSVFGGTPLHSPMFVHP